LGERSQRLLMLRHVFEQAHSVGRYAVGGRHQVATLTHTALKLIRTDPAILKRETLPMCQAHPGSAQRSVIIRMD
ncbi:hypothetical protein, partial [Bacillus cereus]|uniref:hypothetical protein n=1 Tax=Bacillus cereus TaxID=1396 RepID=UPI0018DEDD89